jgi:hypothetical protein
MVFAEKDSESVKAMGSDNYSFGLNFKSGKQVISLLFSDSKNHKAFKFIRLLIKCLKAPSQRNILSEI